MGKQVSTTSNNKEQFMLRIKKGSEIDSVARTMLNLGGSVTLEEFDRLAGSHGKMDALRRISRSCDNLRLTVDDGKYKLVYVDVNPGTPVSVGVDVNVKEQVVAPQAQPVEQEQEPAQNGIRWPQAPPMIESLGDAFKEPTWFKTMAKMVKNGRHIALAGAPGVGKDTAVQELAAQQGRILVTVGGDAGFRKRDLTGSVQIAGGKSFLEVGEYAAAVVNGWWVLLTEVNAADADALMFLNTQLAAPYVINIGGKAYPVHPEFRLFITYNPGLVGTKPLPQSFKDRFFSIQIANFTAAQLKNLLVAHGMPADVEWAETVVKYGIVMAEAQERGALRYQITTRRLQDAVLLLTEGICDNVKEALQQAVIAAIDSPVEAKVARQVLNDVI